MKHPRRILPLTLASFLATLDSAIALAQDKIVNGHFDSDTAHWVSAQPEIEIAWSPLDVNGSANSGSALVSIPGPDGINSAALQCVHNLSPGQLLDFRGRIRVPSSNPASQIFLGFFPRDQPGCAGTTITAGIVQFATSGVDFWGVYRVRGFEAPPGVASALIQLQEVKNLPDPAAVNAYYDDIELHLIPPPPAGAWLTSPELAGFRAKVRIGGPAGRLGRREADCIEETLCVSGALKGRSEVFVRVVGPKPNGFRWPTLVKFTTSTAEIWIEEIATGDLVYYLLPGATPGSETLAGLFDRTGFRPSEDEAEGIREVEEEPGQTLTLGQEAVEPPPGSWLTTIEQPGFRFKVRIGGPAGKLGKNVTDCIEETLCVSGALAGRSEIFARVVGPKPNGYLWPTLVKFNTTTTEVWVEQVSTGQVQYYSLPGSGPGDDSLPGLVDRFGFLP